MTELPKNLKSFQSQAKEYLASGRVRDVEFSGGTYQVLVVDRDTKNEEWAFLQLDSRGKLKDSFCSCAESEANHECVHQAVAFLYVFGDKNIPLHVRFENSLWNSLCKYCADTLGTRPDVLKVVEPGNYRCRSQGGKVIFSVKAQTSTAVSRLEKIMFDRQQETEETSLKFSNLSPEEIQLWRQGKPNAQLRYELSFWNDLAKLLMLWQEEEKDYTVSFSYSAKKLPNRIQIFFNELALDFYLSEEELPLIIPALATVKTPLAIHSEPTEEIESILYDQKNKSLIVNPKDGVEHKKAEHIKGIEIGDWIFVPGDGFYLKNRHFLLTSRVLQGKQLEDALNEHAQTIKGIIKGCKIHDSPMPVSYTIFFDDQWNLHVKGYLFSPGDLSSSGSYCIGTWAYLENDGFYRMEDRYLEDIESVIPADEVSDFVTSHRLWLNNQVGYRIHISHLEADLSYELTKDRYLTFSRSLTLPDTGQRTKDFGRWVFIEGQGFFSKVSMQTTLPVRAGVAIPPDQIPIFIRINRDELQLVTGFFSSKCPVEKSGLNIQLTKQEQVAITPEYSLLPEYLDKVVYFFDDFVYVEGEGFHELPVDIRLPERFRHPLVIENENLATFLNYELATIEPFANYIDPRLRKAANSRLLANSIEGMKTEERGDHYKLKLRYETEYGAIPVASLWWSFMKKKRFVFSDAGLIDLGEKRFSWFKTLGKERVDRKENSIELTTLELMRLNAFDEIIVPLGKDVVTERSKELLKELTEFRIPEEPDLTGLQSHLRPYQQIGVRWLWFLYRHGLSGLLCDDMGLGKTHQAMALLVAITNFYRKQESGGKKRHFLVICPTSVIYHWQEKLSAFLPELKVWTFYGAKRSLESFFENCDILLTSYGVWRNEAEALVDHDFEVAIFDEIQIAKNHTSRIYSALTMVKSRMRIGLSGTPIENHLRELKTLFDITLPTYMPGDNDYREFFVRPIEKEDSRERKDLLSRLIKPFVMRRKKEDVLLDLPEKIEEIAHCDLEPQQHKLYMEVLTSSRDKIIDELRDDNKPIPYMHIFALLSHLKQICNHPAAYLKKPESYKQYHSGKWDLFVELLSEARESQQKVVVFSQYLNMLDIIEEYLKEHGIEYASIRGATVNRGEQLARFKNDPKCEVFVASLQAAGLGVDLTSASVVIHYDRWWNAARENQATDRVHRIGQVRGVQVFKLMTKGTLEEHIDMLIAKKGKLMEDIVGIDDHQVIKKFERKEIMQLLQIVPLG